MKLGRRTLVSMSELAPARGATKQKTRVGRGPGSGRGKTAGRGTKGQKARQGVHPWFEGGQTPITKLFPKVGFTSALPQPVEINIGRIQRLIDAKRLDPSKPITVAELYKSKALSPNVSSGVKILGAGAEMLRQPITITASKATSSAIAAIEKAGGKFTAEYMTPLTLQAMTRPEQVLNKFGRLPLPARPVDRRSIEFYRDESRRGYLVGAPDAPKVKQQYKKKVTTVSPLVELLEKLEVEDPSEKGAREGFSS